MVPIHGRPLLDYWMQTLVGHGVEKILVNTHYLPQPVLNFLENSSWMPWVSLVHEPELLGTGGTVLRNRDFFEGQPFVVAHADNLTIFDAEDFIHAHRARPSDAEMTMMVFESDDPRSCGIVETDGRGVVLAFHEKVASPPGNLANAAVYIFEQTVFDLLVRKGKPDIDLSTEIIPEMIGHISTYKNANYHRDIGNIASWQEANRSFPRIPAEPQNVLAWSAACGAEGRTLRSAIDDLLK